MSENKLEKYAEKINSISPSFCVAKWKQVTLHLQNGHTHSCHHPGTHLVPLDEIQKNPSALHNTKFKKLQRKMMLDGERPNECQYCWNVEDSGNNHYSDRIYKSSEPVWALPYMDDIVNKPWDDDVSPSYLEVSFGNVCNFKCSYCSPNISSQWMDEIERFGPYPTSTSFNDIFNLKHRELMPIPNNQYNPYVEAFWNWFPTIYKELKHFRITGGEPLLNKNTFKVLDYIIENPNENLEVAINTNMNPPKEVFIKFLEKIKIIFNEKKVKKIKLFTSAEAHGKCAEYIRFGMNYEQWIENIYKTFNEIPGIQFTIMSTYNILSVTSYNKFLQDVLNIKRKFGKKDYLPILLDIPYLRYPKHQSIFIMNEQHLQMLDSHIDFMCMHSEYEKNYRESVVNKGFREDEIEKLKRIHSMVKNSIENPNEFVGVNRSDFITFVDEHDERRGTNFLFTFPELVDTYNEWKLEI